MIIILLDTREHNSGFVLKFLQSQSIDAEGICWPQNTGCDIYIQNTAGSCAVQRKVAVPELTGELDEIMYDIIPRLKNFSENPILLVEENFGIGKDGYLYGRDTNRESQMLATSYYGYLETIRKSGCDVVTTRDLNQSVWWMVAMHGYLAKHHYPKHQKCFTVREQVMGMLQCVPGVGEARAGKALEAGSIRALAAMQKVPGLTEKQSEKVLRALRWCE